MYVLSVYPLHIQASNPLATHQISLHTKYPLNKTQFKLSRYVPVREVTKLTPGKSETQAASHAAASAEISTSL